ncbi:MAG TPA: hypothetical protein QGH10_26985, partial [Armatimonadota bacterium]|nr:hypothetical protein [Armatimonadota bacterium]
MTLRFAATRPRPARPWWVLAAVLPMALAGRATHAAPRPSHPHLFFADDDVEALQKRVESGVPQQAWESIVARCESEVGPDSAGAALLQDVQDGDRALQGFCSSATRYNDPLIDLATGWALSGDRRFADRLETLLRAAQGLFPEGIDFWRQ